MLGFLTLWPLALRRMRARWHLLLPLLIGAILAVALLSSTFIYGDSVRQLGLDHAFNIEEQEDLDIDLLAYYAPTHVDAYTTVRGEMDLAIDRNVTWFVDRVSRGMKGSTFFVNQVAGSGGVFDTSPEVMAANDEAATDPRLRSVFIFEEQFLDKTTVIAGEAPPEVIVETDERFAPTTRPEIPALILEETAALRGLRVGDRILMMPHWEDVSPWVIARVTGIARPNDPADRYWTSNFWEQVENIHGQNFIPLHLPEQTFLAGVGALFPKMLSDYSFSLFVDQELINVHNVGLAEFGLNRMESQLRSRLNSFLSRTNLDVVLANFVTRDLFGRIPLLIVTLMIVAIMIYYLIMVANIVVDRSIGEIAMLRSRGADGSQVVALYVWEALLITIVAFLAGPILALGATSLLGYTPAFSDLTGGEALTVRLTVQAGLMAFAGTMAAFAAMLLPTIKGFRLNLLRFKTASGRPQAASVFTRYYIDIFVAILAGLLFWELTQRGSLVSTTIVGERSVDEALLAAPALILLAVSLLFLRFFPLVVRTIGWVAGRAGSAWLALGFWQIGRNPMPYALPILLLMLASSVAMFAANFGATVSRSYEDRSLYAAGGDVRLEGGRLTRNGPSVSFLDVHGDVAGAEAVSPVYRGRTSPAMRLFDSTRFQLLAVDPETFPEAAWYRGDFSGRSLDELMGVLKEDDPARAHGLPLPEDIESLGVWVLPASPRRDMELRARIADANGRYQDYSLGRLDSREWTLKEASLVVTDAPLGFGRSTFVPQRPLRLVSLTVRQRSGITLRPGAVYLDSIQATVASSDQPVVIERIREGIPVQVFNDSFQAAADSLDFSTTLAREGESSAATFLWGSGSILSTRGLNFAAASDPHVPLHAVMSRSVLEGQGLSKGDQLDLSLHSHVIRAQVAEVVDFFPTLSPYGGGFIVISLPALLERLNSVELSVERFPTELWVGIPGQGVERARIVEGIELETGQRIVDQQKLLDSFEADPLIAASWNGILRMAFIAVVFSTLMGFSVYSFVQAQRRRVEFAMLRSIGLSNGSLALVVLLEQLIVIVLGLALGSWLGIQLTSILMPYLGLNEAGTQVLPPFAVRINWTAILITYGIMSVAFLLATIALIGFFSRVAIQRALRFGEV